MPPALHAPVAPEAVTSAPLAVRVAVCWPQKPKALKWTADPNPSPLHRLTATLTVYDMGNMFPCVSVVLPQTRYCASHKNWTSVHQLPLQNHCFIGSGGGS